MNQKIYLFLALLLLLGGKTYAQNDFRSGYIITTAMDTVRGEINYLENSKNYKFCMFRNQKETQKYLPNELLEFAFDNNKRFSAQILPGEFVEVIVEGPMSLYKSSNFYHVRKDGQIYALESKMEEQLIKSQVVRVEKGRWRNILSVLISDCIPNHQKVISRVRLKERSLSNLVLQYNACRGHEVIETKSDKAWTTIEYHIAVGLAYSIVGNTGPIPSEYFENELSGFTPSVGGGIELKSPRFSEKAAITAEIYFAHANLRSSYVKKYGLMKHFFNNQLRLNTLSLPIAAKYIIPFKDQNTDIFFQAGGVIDLQFSNSFTVKVDKVYDNATSSSVFDLPQQNKDFQFGYNFGMGFAKTFSKYKADFSLRYIYMSQLDDDFFREVRNQRLLFTVKLSKK